MTRNSAHRKDLFDGEVNKIIGVLSKDSEQDLVILVVPSHDQRNQRLNDQDQWAEAGMKVLADLYRGATAFRNLKGIFKTDRGEYLHDEPILLESYAKDSDIEAPSKLNTLVAFLKRMGRETNQDTVMVIIGTAFFYLSEFGKA